jgi:hypothetical protein
MRARLTVPAATDETIITLPQSFNTFVDVRDSDESKSDPSGML